MAKVDDNDEFERLEKLLVAHKKLITEMMLRTENLQAAIQLARRRRIEEGNCEQGDMPPSTAS